MGFTPHKGQIFSVFFFTRLRYKVGIRNKTGLVTLSDPRKTRIYIFWGLVLPWIRMWCFTSFFHKPEPDPTYFRPSKICSYLFLCIRNVSNKNEIITLIVHLSWQNILILYATPYKADIKILKLWQTNWVNDKMNHRIASFKENELAIKLFFFKV